MGRTSSELKNRVKYSKNTTPLFRGHIFDNVSTNIHVPKSLPSCLSSEQAVRVGSELCFVKCSKNPTLGSFFYFRLDLLPVDACCCNLDFFFLNWPSPFLTMTILHQDWIRTAVLSSRSCRSWASRICSRRSSSALTNCVAVSNSSLRSSLRFWSVSRDCISSCERMSRFFLNI